MITITWYNVVAITVGLFVVFLIWRNDRSGRSGTGALEWLNEAINIVVILVLAALFYALWGGIFWW